MTTDNSTGRLAYESPGHFSTKAFIEQDPFVKNETMKPGYKRRQQEFVKQISVFHQRGARTSGLLMDRAEAHLCAVVAGACDIEAPTQPFSHQRHNVKAQAAQRRPIGRQSFLPRQDGLMVRLQAWSPVLDFHGVLKDGQPDLMLGVLHRVLNEV